MSDVLFDYGDFAKTVLPDDATVFKVQPKTHMITLSCIILTTLSIFAVSLNHV